MTDRIEPIVYTVPEVALLLRTSRSTIHRGIASGRIPAVRYGPKVVRVPRWWVEEVMGKAA